MKLLHPILFSTSFCQECIFFCKVKVSRSFISSHRISPDPSWAARNLHSQPDSCRDSVSVIIGGDFNRKPPKGIQPEYNDMLNNFCLSNNLVDYWRMTNPKTMQFTWISPADANLRSRLDYLLVSPNITILRPKCDIQSTMKAGLIMIAMIINY